MASTTDTIDILALSPMEGVADAIPHQALLDVSQEMEEGGEDLSKVSGSPAQAVGGATGAAAPSSPGEIDLSGNNVTNLTYYIDLEQELTTMGKNAFRVWKFQPNTPAHDRIGDVVSTYIKLGEYIYPVLVNLIPGNSPLTIGSEYVDRMNWKVGPAKTILTQHGNFFVNCDNSINNLETENVYKCEAIFSSTKNKKEQIRRLHKVFGHCTKENLVKLIKNSSCKDKFTVEEIDKEISSCPSCNLTKKQAPRKRVALPKAGDFNERVSLDLKVYSTSSYVLYAVDEFTRLTRAEHICNKRPETIMKALDKIWLTGGGYRTWGAIYWIFH